MPAAIDCIRAFNRFYTVCLGFLEQNYLGTGDSIVEICILFEIHAAVEIFGKRGWLNVGSWGSEVDGLPDQRAGKAVSFSLPLLTITYTGVGLEGGCPAEKDNADCYFLAGTPQLCSAAQITANKGYCDCTFVWRFAEGDDHDVSIGKALQAFPTAPKVQCETQAFTAQNAAAIPCDQVLGAYKAGFERLRPSLRVSRRIVCLL